MEHTAAFDFPIPNEMIEKVTAYLSTEDLFNLTEIGSERLKKCTFGVLRKKLREIPVLICNMLEKGNLEKIKQIFAYVKKENISGEEMGVNTYKFKRHAPKLLYQMLDYHQIEAVKLPEFLVSEVPEFLCKMSEKGDLEKIKQIFAYVNQENISVEEMGVEINEVNQGKKPTLVDTNSGTYECPPMIPAMCGIWKLCDGRTPLILAALYGHHHVCQYLIKEQKANLEAKDDNRNTALICAASSNNLEVLKVLLKYKANCRAKGKDGCHAAYVAAFNGNVDALKMLVEKDGDVIDLKGPNGETPLITASKKGYVGLCKYLLEEKKANINLKDNDGKTALQHAEDLRIIGILKKVLSY